jgi:hypothetical protein
MDARHPQSNWVGIIMTVFGSLRTALAAAASAATLLLGTGAASAATVTIEFGTVVAFPSSPYIEDGFEIAGTFLLLNSPGNPPAAIALDDLTPSLTLTRTGGGAFSLSSFDYACNSFSACAFSVGTTPITANSSAGFTTVSPTGFTNITSLMFTRANGFPILDNIVLTFDDVTPVPVPAALPLLLAGVGGLGLMARRKRKAA